MNHLSNESSLYLRQHADNPVDWRPWCEAALETARESDRPILLSIGYSACHWCHVMAHESFEDEATAKIMNRLFVNIKVDREERPDLDRIYQTSHQLLARRAGGWPLTVFLTPDDNVAFFAGTYFPPGPRHGLPAFRDLLQQIARLPVAPVDPGEGRLEPVAGGVEEVGLGVVEAQLLGDVRVFVVEGDHQAEEERRVGDLVGGGRARGEHAVLDAQVRDFVVEAVAGAVPPVDGPVVQPQRAELRELAALEQRLLGTLLADLDVQYAVVQHKLLGLIGSLKNCDFLAGCCVQSN